MINREKNERISVTFDKLVLKKMNEVCEEFKCTKSSLLEELFLNYINSKSSKQ